MAHGSHRRDLADSMESVEVLAPVQGHATAPCASVAAASHLSGTGRTSGPEAIERARRVHGFGRFRLHTRSLFAHGETPLLATPAPDARAIRHYDASTEVAIVGTAMGADYYYVSPATPAKAASCPGPPFAFHSAASSARAGALCLGYTAPTTRVFSGCRSRLQVALRHWRMEGDSHADAPDDVQASPDVDLHCFALLLPLTGTSAEDATTALSRGSSRKTDPRGPFTSIKWFCKDGTVLPPAVRAKTMAAISTASGARTRELRDKGYLVATLLAGIDASLRRSAGIRRSLRAAPRRALSRCGRRWLILRRASSYRGAIQRRTSRRRPRSPDRAGRAIRLARRALSDARIGARVCRTARLGRTADPSAVGGSRIATAVAAARQIHGSPDAGDAQRARLRGPQCVRGDESGYRRSRQRSMPCIARCPADTLRSRARSPRTPRCETAHGRADKLER
jgi:hypothetical protein